MLRPWSSGAVCSWLLRACCCAAEKRRNYRSSSQRILHGIGSIKAAHMALTGDHYRTLEAIKQLEPVINDSSQGPADLAQWEREAASRPVPNLQLRHVWSKTQTWVENTNLSQGPSQLQPSNTLNIGHTNQPQHSSSVHSALLGSHWSCMWTPVDANQPPHQAPRAHGALGVWGQEWVLWAVYSRIKPF